VPIPLLDLFSTGEATIFAAGAVLLAAVAILGDVLRISGVPAVHSRRVVHMLVGLTVAGAPFVLPSPRVLVALAIFFVGANAVLWARGWLPGMHEARPSSLGTVLFPLSVLPAIGLTWFVDAGRIPAFQVAFLVLAVADPAAGWLGDERKDKSVEGSLAFGLVALAASIVCLLTVGPDAPLGAVITGGVVIAAATTAAEAVGRNGWDNLFVVLAAVGATVPWLESPASPLVMFAVLAGIVFAGLAYAAHALSWDGALAGGLLAASFVAWVPLEWAGPAVVFFVGSSALSVIGRERKASLTERVQKAGPRDAAQVLANGGVAWILLGLTLATSDPLIGFGILGAFAAAAADTWATELGTLSTGQPVSLRTWTRVAPGTSGAVSGVGTLASAGGAASVALTALLVGLTDVGGMLLIVVAGIAGAWTDSLTGAYLQAIYRNPVTGIATERRPAHTGEPERGYAFIDNETVNAIATATGACLAILLAGLVMS